MYALNEKNEIIRRIRNGESLVDLSKEKGISMSTLNKWMEDAEILDEINELIDTAKLEEAKEKLEGLKGKISEIERLFRLRKIAKVSGKMDEENEILDEILGIEPNNIKAIIGKTIIARKRHDLETEKFWIDKELELEPENITAIIQRTIIAKEEKDTETEKLLLDRQIKIDTKNITAIIKRIIIARREGDTETERALLDRELEIEPHNLGAIVSRIMLARKMGELETERRLIDVQLELQPDNIRTIKRRITIARLESDKLTEKRLLDRLIEMRAYNLTEADIRRRIKLARIDGDETVEARCQYLLENSFEKTRINCAIENEMLQKAKMNSSELNPIDNIRRLIYESTDMVNAVAEIKEKLEDVNETKREILLAELYFASGVPARAEKSLKLYKKKLESQEKTSMDDIRLVKQALEIVRGARTKKYNWDNLWKKREEFEQEDNER